MKIESTEVNKYNAELDKQHQIDFSYLQSKLEKENIDVGSILKKLTAFQIAVPSWALGTGGTRFGRFSGGGEPRTLEEKIADVGLLHALNRSSGAISLHIPWDIPEDPAAIKSLADSLGVKFDAVNSNTFQDQADQELSYKYGSLANSNAQVRQHAINHNIEVIQYGKLLGSHSITIWLADGSCFPGQQNFKKALHRTLESLEQIYEAMPYDWKMFIEYKPYEPNFYSTVIQDWGTSHLLASQLGERAYSLVDLGHHLPNTNIEQIVATLMMLGKLGGFHFNDSKYGDDDVTTGSLKPYQLFLIFNELAEGMEDPSSKNPYPAWMIDASHNVKDPLEDLMQSMEAIKIAYTQALLIDRYKLEEARDNNDAVLAQEILQHAFRTDVRPLLAEARLQAGGAIDPLYVYRKNEIRKQLIKERGVKTISTGL